MPKVFSHSSPRVTVGEFVCQAPASGEGEEEASSSHQIVFPTSGIFVHRSRRGSAFGDPNHVLFFNRKEPYRVTHPVEGGDRCLVVIVESQDLLEVISKFDPTVEERPEAPFQESHRLISSSIYRHRHELTTLFESRWRLPEGGSGAPPRGAARSCVDDLEVHERVLMLLEEVFASRRSARWVRGRALQARTHQRRLETIEAARVLLAHRFRESFSLVEIARAVDSSPYHLSRIFRQEVGLTMHRYRHRLRLRSALERLAEGEFDLTRLALDLGFFDHSHFTSAFRNEFGCPPSQFRAVAQSSCTPC